MIDARAGLTPTDRAFADVVRKSGKPVIVIANKSEGRSAAAGGYEAFALGMGEPVSISAEHGEGLSDLYDAICAALPEQAAASADTWDDEPAEQGARPIRVAVIGRPNVGKSTLINRLIGEDRLLTGPEAGITRDSITVPLSWGGQEFLLHDTAGMRRRARIDDKLEKLSVGDALEAIKFADVVVGLMDTQAGFEEQDLRLADLIEREGRAVVLGINKWDRLPTDQREQVRTALDRRLPFMDFADVHYISALHGTAIFDLLQSGRRAAEAAVRDLPTPDLNRVLKDAVQAYPTPVAHRSRIKLTYAHQGGRRPPLIVIHGNQTEALPQNYRRYLVGCFRKAFRLRGTPIRVELRAGKNPFAGKRNRLTPRQVKRRARVRGRGRYT
jgi:GTP-binding protein